MNKTAIPTIYDLKNMFEGYTNCLIIAGGPSAVNWEKYCDSKTFVIVCNGAVIKVKDRTDLHLCTEVTGYRFAWAKSALPTRTFRLFHAATDKKLAGLTNLIYIVRSYYLSGFNPRNYYSINPIPSDIWNGSFNWYLKYGGGHGVNKSTRLEYGLLKGPVTRLGTIDVPQRRQATGTVSLQALHLAAYLGFINVKTIGMDFSLQHGHHWYSSELSVPYMKGASDWSPDENFITVNGIPTTWFFAMGAAICAKRRIDFLKAGMTWRDYSQGLLQEPGIENFFQYEKPAGQVFWTYK